MAFGSIPLSQCREVTILCRMDRRTRESSFKAWERMGLAGEDAPRKTLYEGSSWAQAYAALTAASEVIEEGLR